MTIRPLAFLAVFCSTTLVSGCVETMAYEDNHVLPCDGESVQMVSQCVGAISDQQELPMPWQLQALELQDHAKPPGRKDNPPENPSVGGGDSQLDSR